MLANASDRGSMLDWAARSNCAAKECLKFDLEKIKLESIKELCF